MHVIPTNYRYLKLPDAWFRIVDSPQSTAHIGHFANGGSIWLRWNNIRLHRRVRYIGGTIRQALDRFTIKCSNVDVLGKIHQTLTQTLQGHQDIHVWRYDDTVSIENKSILTASTDINDHWPVNYAVMLISDADLRALNANVVHSITVDHYFLEGFNKPMNNTIQTTIAPVSSNPAIPYIEPAQIDL